jgi:hypothetical protein
MRGIRLATAAVSLALGSLVIVWAAYAYWVAAHGGSGDLTAAGWAIYATIGLLIGLGFFYVARRTTRRSSGD